jgi:hypothetical protein
MRDHLGNGPFGNINEKNIQNHAPQEVRNEEKRLKQLAAVTPIERAKNDLSIWT